MVFKAQTFQRQMYVNPTWSVLDSKSYTEFYKAAFNFMNTGIKDPKVPAIQSKNDDEEAITIGPTKFEVMIDKETKAFVANFSPKNKKFLSINHDDDSLSTLSGHRKKIEFL